MGGTSSEREISFEKWTAILKSLLRQDYDAYSIDINSEKMKFSPLLKMILT